MDLLQLTAEAKERLTIPDVWARLGLPGEARPRCVVKSPFRQDRHGASFSIFSGGTLFKDWADGTKGDVVCFIEQATGSDRATAMRTLVELAGMGHLLATGNRSVPGVKPVKIEPRAALPDRGTGWGFRPLPEMPEGLEVTAERIETLARQRGLADWAVLAATEQGLLCFVRKWGRDCWMVRDSTGCNAQVRRLDGEPWQVNGQALKGLTLPGSWAAWPLGCADLTAEAQRAQSLDGRERGILLVEGAPDLLAAVQWLEETGQGDAFMPVAMLGAGQPIQGSALCHFVGKHVRIMEQRDPAKTRRDGTTYFPGQDAARKWQQQLAPVAASCRILHLPDAMPGKDLNDYLKWPGRQAHDLPSMLAEVGRS